MYLRIFCLIFLLFAGLLPQNVCAQDMLIIKKYAQAPEAKIKRHAFNTPDKYSQNAQQLTQYLIEPFDNKLDRLRVIAYWIASHIFYDTYKLNWRNYDYHYDVLKTRMGICMDFARLFQEMSQYAGVRGVKIETGFVVDTNVARKHYPKRSLKDGHAWNSVKINNKVYYIDTTWMATQEIITQSKSSFNSLSHKFEVKKRSQSALKKTVTTNIRTYYFLFTPQDEVEKYQRQHFPVDREAERYLN